jgi:hypothetical protein
VPGRGRGAAGRRPTIGITADLSPGAAFDLALHDGQHYGELLHDAHPAIAAFGGMFLAMLFLDFVFDERDICWLGWIERPLARIGRLDQLPVVVASVFLVVSAQSLARADKAISVLVSGLLGLVTYVLVKGLGKLFERRTGLIGVGFIAAAFLSSLVRNRRAVPELAPAQTSYCSVPEVRLRGALTMMSSASLTHTNGWQRSFQPSTKRRMAASRSATLGKLPAGSPGG